MTYCISGKFHKFVDFCLVNQIYFIIGHIYNGFNMLVKTRGKKFYDEKNAVGPHDSNFAYNHGLALRGGS